MKNILPLFLLIIFFNDSKNKKSDNSQLNLFKEFNYTYNNPISENILFENIKLFKNSDNYIFRNFPRRNEEDMKEPTFTKYHKEKNEFIKWPDDNDYNENLKKDCNHFKSIIDFEFNEHNIYLLDEGNEYCPVTLWVFNSEGENQLNYKILEKNNHEIFLTNFVLDNINNYVYIPFYNLTDTDGNNNDYKAGIFVKKLNDNDYGKFKIVYLRDKIFFSDEKYNFENDFIQKYFPTIQNKTINVALTCDAEYLLICPLSSRMIYSVLTSKLKDDSVNSISFNDVNEAYKNDASSSLVLSNMDNLYLTGLEKNAIYFANQIQYDLSAFDFKLLDKKAHDKLGWPAKLSITEGVLYIISKKIEKIDENIYNISNQVFKVSIDDDNSYVYECAGVAYKWKFIAYFIWGIFALVVLFVFVFVYVENDLDQELINKKK